jgi:cohesin complex subunit SA-1/2
MDATSLSNTNNTKILELEDKLATSLRDAVAGRDELEIASFTEDEVLRLGAICARLSMLAGARDMSVWMEEDEGGKQSSAWDIVSALLDRGRLGYKEEEMVRARSLFGSNMADNRIDDRSGVEFVGSAHHLEGQTVIGCDPAVPR